MKRLSFIGKLAGLGLVSALVGCSGSAVLDGSGGASNDAGASSTAGRAGESGVGGSGVGGSGVGGSAAGGHSGTGNGGKGGAGGSAGSGSVCISGSKMMADCNTCDCIGGQWECTAIACPIKTCGGMIGNACSANEYCAYMPGQHCGAADASSTCQPRPSACVDIYMPVCGCDNKSYSSTCDAAAHGQGVIALGACAQGTL